MNGWRGGGGQEGRVSLLFYILINDEAGMLLNPSSPHEMVLLHSLCVCVCVSAREVNIG